MFQVRTPTLTSHYLELVNLYASIGVLLSRIPHRKVVLAIELIFRTQKGGQKASQLSSNQVKKTFKASQV